jgi:hypothetical protein
MQPSPKRCGKAKTRLQDAAGSSRSTETGSLTFHWKFGGCRERAADRKSQGRSASDRAAGGPNLLQDWPCGWNVPASTVACGDLLRHLRACLKVENI